MRLGVFGKSTYIDIVLTVFRIQEVLLAPPDVLFSFDKFTGRSLVEDGMTGTIGGDPILVEG